MLLKLQVRGDYVTGVVGILISVFLMAFQDALVKLSSADISLWQLFALRSLFAVPILCLISRMTTRKFSEIGNLLGGWILLRSALLVGMYVCLYTVIPYIPLSTLAAGFYTGPIFIVIFSAVLKGERVRPIDRFAIGLGFVGVLLISKPSTEGISLLVLLPVLSGVFYAAAAVMTRTKLHHNGPTELALSLNILLGVVGFIIVGILDGFDLGNGGNLHFMLVGWQPLAPTDMGIIAVLGVMLVAISITLAFAYRSAPPPVIAGFDYSYLIFSGLFGFLLFNEVPAASSLLGMLMIAGAGMAMLKR
jgi:drug/metabolite transporter (DMT)-like permease